MKLLYLGLTLSLYILTPIHTFAGQYLVDTDFDKSMTHSDVNALSDMPDKMSQEYNFYKTQYEAKKPSKMPTSSIPIIPKIMHQIWIGGTKLPPLYEHYLRECKALHPDWDFKLWTDDNINSMDLQYRDLYDKARSWLGKSDILRYEILMKYGGVYRDTDVKCIRPLDELLYKYDFFAGLETYNHPWLKLFLNNSNYNGPYIPINNGFIGATPQHNILNYTLRDINKNFATQWQNFDDGQLSLGEISQGQIVVLSTMYPLSKAFLNYSTLTDKSVVLPANYIFPRTWRALHRSNGLISKAKSYYHDLINLNDASILDITLPSEALVNHNIDKKDITLPQWTDKNIQKFYSKYLPVLSKPNKHRLSVIQEISSANNNISLNTVSLIPEKLIFIVLNSDEKRILNTTIQAWKLFNASFEIDIWDQEKIMSTIPNLFTAVQHTTHSVEELRFMLGIEILNKSGGHYVDFRAQPLQSIFELGNKYMFYGALAPINQNSPNIELSTKLVGSPSNSSLLKEALKASYNSKTPLTESLLDISIKYSMIYGKINILPTTAFHPVPYEYGTGSKLYNILSGGPKDFYGTTVFSVLE